MGPDDTQATSTAPGQGATSSSSTAPSQEPTSVIQKLDNISSSPIKMREPLDETNWPVWCQQIHRIFKHYAVEDYVYGIIPRPDPSQDAALATLWATNDNYAQMIITNNIKKEQMVHVSLRDTSNQIWRNLGAIHETKDYQVAVAIQRGQAQTSVGTT